MANDYTPKPIRVIDENGIITTYRSKLQTCNALDMTMSTLQGFLKRGQTVPRGRFKNWTFESLT